MSHFAFFEALQATEQGSAEWELVSCGYMVMRCFDDWCAIGPAQTALGTAVSEIEAALNRLVISNTLYTNVFRAVLQSLMEAANWKVMSIIAPILAYGSLLEVDCQWALAADVYGAVADALDREASAPSHDTVSHSMARRRQALSLRTKGIFDEAEVRYRHAVVTADRVGDAAASHSARIGLTNLYRVKGDFPASLEALNTMLTERNHAQEFQVDWMTSEIIHNRGAVRHEMEDYDGAFSDFIVAYQTAINPIEQDLILNDLAGCALRKGYYDLAHMALNIVLDRCPLPHPRQFALINMVMLTILQGDHDAFVRFRAQLEPRHWGDVVTAFAHLVMARGVERFGTQPQARTAYRKAARFAEKTKVPKVYQEALERLAELQK